METILMFLWYSSWKKNLLILYISGASLHILQAPFIAISPFPRIPFIFCFHLTDPPILTQISFFLYCTAFPILLLTDILFSHQLLISCISPLSVPHRTCFIPQFCIIFFFDINQGLPASSPPHILCTFLSAAAFLEALIKSINHWNHLIPSFLHCCSGALFSPLWVK